MMDDALSKIAIPPGVQVTAIPKGSLVSGTRYSIREYLSLLEARMRMHIPGTRYLFVVWSLATHIGVGLKRIVGPRHHGLGRHVAGHELRHGGGNGRPDQAQEAHPRHHLDWADPLLVGLRLVVGVVILILFLVPPLFLARPLVLPRLVGGTRCLAPVSSLP